MDWTKILETLIVSGGFLTFFLITEKKAAAALDNITRVNAILQAQYEDALARNKEKDKKIDDLYSHIGTLHADLDNSNTKTAKAEMKRCDRINCGKRLPPLVDRWHVDDDVEVIGMEEGEGKQ